jgi:peptidyl-prolyl cis-trans isomerase SurA
MIKKIHFILIIVVILSGAYKTMAQFEGDSIIDGVIAVVGSKMILKSDIESQYLEFRMQGGIQGTASTMKCQILENMVMQKLLVNQAEIDSITVTDAMVENEMDNRMRYFISQVGSPEKLEEYFQKSIVEIKNDMREIIRENLLIREVQSKINQNINITPSEVKAYFRKLPKDSIPEISSEVEIGIIVKQPAISEAERQEVKERLRGLRERVQKGDDFSTLAVLYSEDPGSARKGGELGMFKRGEMRPEFEAAAFKLKPGEVSDVVETEDGYHIIQMIERRGEYINVRHILLQPQVSTANLTEAKDLLDSVANLIMLKKLTFAEAVVKFSDDPSKNNGGLMINQATGDSKFELSQLDPKIFFVIDKLKVGEISAAVIYKTDRGKDEYRLYFLKERTAPHKANLENDYAKIQEIALNQKRTTIMNDWYANKAAKTYIRINPPYNECKFQYGWFKQEETKK